MDSEAGAWVKSASGDPPICFQTQLHDIICSVVGLGRPKVNHTRGVAWCGMGLRSGSRLDHTYGLRQQTPTQPNVPLLARPNYAKAHKQDTLGLNFTLTVE